MAESDYTIGEAPPSSTEAVTWTASEYIAHEKSAGWYVQLAAVALLISAAVYWLTHDSISAGVVIIGALFLAIYGGRQPRQLTYRLDAGGLIIGSKRFAFTEFRSFAVADEGAFSSIVLMPLKRFAPLTTIYYAPQDEDKILAVLEAHLPLEEHKPDPVDKLMRRIRF